MMRNRKSPGRCLVRFGVAVLLAICSPIAWGTPKIFYTDILTGPNTGGENNNGAYLTIFGAGFGASQGSSQVTINNVPVAAVKQWSDTRITVQPGPAVTSGAIRVIVGGAASNSDQTFTVVPGKIYFVSLSGSDIRGKPGRIDRPFRSVQKTLDRSDFGPGDHLVIRGGDWTDNNGIYDAFFSIHHKSGTAAAPIVVMGYPGETVNFIRTAGNGVVRGIHSYATEGHYVIANLHVHLNGGGGVCIGMGPEDVRIVNNEGEGLFEDSGGSACIAGSGRKYRILGNDLHDNGGSKLYHAIYIDGRNTRGVDDIEIAYNRIARQTGGRGIQIYGDTGTPLNNIRIHHNLIHDIHLDGILLGRDSGSGLQVYDNVVYRTANPALQGPSSDHGATGGCIRFASPFLTAEVYNNTFVNCAVDQDPESAAMRFERAKRLVLRNNIVASPYFLLWDVDPAAIISSNNLWMGTGAPPSWEAGAVRGDPLFVDAAKGNFRLRPGSAAMDRGSAAVERVVRTDFDGTARPQGAGYDIGAFEFVPAAATRQPLPK
jgi:hypothetical protein